MASESLRDAADRIPSLSHRSIVRSRNSGISFTRSDQFVAISARLSRRSRNAFAVGPTTGCTGVTNPARTNSFRTDEATSARMSRIRQAGTLPELAVRTALRSLGHGYRTRNRDLPGTPDLANRKKRWVIFVHGCFWHRHPGCVRSTTPRRNRQLWEQKFDSNMARDASKAARLRRLGYSVLTVWECQTVAGESLQKLLARRLSLSQHRHNVLGRHT